MTTINAVGNGLTGQTGTGNFVGSTSPTLVTPLLGTPTSGILTNTTAGGGLRSFQTFTSGTAATYTKPANVTSILIEVVGGGGGGGGALGGASTHSSGGGGGSGGYARLWVPAASATYTYTVGAAGAAGTAGTNAGGTGGTTTFSASSLQATGGVGGSGGITQTVAGFTAVGGAGGVGSNGNLNAAGAPGLFGMNDGAGTSLSGNGGSSHYGGGALASGSPNAGNAAGNYGSGGSGGSAFVTSLAGGAGSAGLIIVWEFS